MPGTTADTLVYDAARATLARDASRIADALMSLVRTHHSVRARLAGGAEAEMGPLMLLVKIAKFGPRRASALAELLCADPSTVSRQVAGLVKAGLLQRESDPDDGRASILVLTPGRARQGGQVLRNPGRRRDADRRRLVGRGSGNVHPAARPLSTRVGSAPRSRHGAVRRSAPRAGPEIAQDTSTASAVLVGSSER